MPGGRGAARTVRQRPDFITAGGRGGRLCNFCGAARGRGCSAGGRASGPAGRGRACAVSVGPEWVGEGREGGSERAGEVRRGSTRRGGGEGLGGLVVGTVQLASVAQVIAPKTACAVN